MTDYQFPITFIAFKEWAIVCRAIAEGRQTLILRKGGIQENRGSFEMEYRQFFLFPTLFHQQNDAVVPEARVELAQIAREFYPQYTSGANEAPSQVTWPTTTQATDQSSAGRACLPEAGKPSRGESGLGGVISLSLCAAVEEVERLTQWEKVRTLAPFHIWTEETIRDRFGWGNENAIHLIVARFYRLPSPVTIPMRDSYGGCTSWITLKGEIPLEGTKPILSDTEFAERIKQIRRAIV